MMTFGESPMADQVPAEAHSLIMHAALEIGDNLIMASDAAGGRYQQPQGISVSVLVDEPLLRNYHLLPSVRGDLLSRLGRLDEGRAEFERAAALTRHTRERDLLLAPARGSASGVPGSGREASHA
jgi:hypothetical protein